MLACLDADYRDGEVVVACLLFEAWSTPSPARELVVTATSTADYVPGQFYRRELPGLLAALDRVTETLETVIVDGYVWLGTDRPGLGFHLFEALGRELPVVGIAKNPFVGNDLAVAVTRGGSKRPLFVTAAGLSVAEAAEGVRDMHGAHRLPTLLTRVDRLCRTAPGDEAG